MRVRSSNIYRLAIVVVMTLALLPGVAAPAMASQQPGATPVGGDPVPPELIAELALPATTEATCENGGPAVTAPPSTGTVTYGDVTAAANGDGTHTFTYTAAVTAEAATLPDVLPDGYTRESDTLATYTVTLPEADCEPQMQSSGSFDIMSGGTNEACYAGTCVRVEIDAPDTIEPGQTLTYTITFTRTGYNPLFHPDPFYLHLPGGASGWSNPGNPCSVQSNGELLCYIAAPLASPGASFTTTVSRNVTESCGSVITSNGGEIRNSPPVSIGSFSTTVACPASPEDPTITDGSCLNGVFVEPSIGLPTTTGITYGYSPSPLPLNGSVTVTATLEADHTWDDTTGWTVTGNTATRDFPVSSTDCTPGLTVTKTVTAVNGQPATSPISGLTKDDVVTYQIVVENTGTAALADLTVADPGVTDLACDPAVPVTTFAPGSTVTCTATHTIGETDLIAESFTNTATASGTWDGTTVSQSDSATVTTVAPAAAITLDKTVAPAEVDAPGTVTYTFVIGNLGRLTLDELALTDDQVDLDDLDCAGGTLPDQLATGASVTCTAPYDITQDMIDAGGPIVNEATVRAVAANETEVTATDTATLTLVQHPEMTFAKTADVDSYAAVDDQITYTFTIGNPGNVTLTGLALTDTLPGLGEITCDTADGALPESLGTGTSVECTATYSVTHDDLDAGAITNAATASSEQTDAIDSAVTVLADQQPALTLEKTATTPDGKTVTIGTVITYTFTVTNSGTVTVEDIVVADALPGLVWDDANPDGAAGTLGPQESATLLATYTVSDEDVAAGVVTNAAQASGTLTGCNNVVTLRQDDGDRCAVVSEVASASVEVMAPPTSTATATETATATATATKTVAVKVLPATGQGGGAAGTPLAPILLALAGLLGVAAIMTSRRWRHSR